MFVRKLLALPSRFLPAGPCPACAQRGGAPLCDPCRRASFLRGSPFRARLGAHPLLFVGAYHLAPGHLAPLGRTLLRFKNGGDRYAGRCLASLLARVCASSLRAGCLVVPVPPDASRLRMRSVSPASSFALALARLGDGKPGLGVLRHVQGHPGQKGLDGDARRRNAVGAFRIGPRDVRGYDIALVDDVITTGSTLIEAARCLSEAGAARVCCVALACADEEMLTQCLSKTEHVGRSATDEP